MATILSTELGASGRSINLGDPVSNRNLSAQTILAYVRPTAQGGGGLGYVFSKAHASNSQWIRLLHSHNSNNPQWSFGSFPISPSSDNTPQRDTVAGSAPYNTWQHVAVTWTGDMYSNLNIKIYLGAGGAALSESAYASGLNSTQPQGSDAGGNLVLMDRNTGSRQFVGDIAYIARWNRVLSIEELTTAQSSGPLEVPSGLVLLFANGQDLGPNAISVVSRSTRVTGTMPPNTNLGGAQVGPNPPTSVVTSNVSASGATIGWTDNSTDETGFAVEISASPYSTWNAVTGSPTAAGATSLAVTGLTASTAYKARVKAKGSAGDSTYAESLAFTTSAVAAVKGVRFTLYDKALAARTAISGITAMWWDSPTPTITAKSITNTAAIDSAGQFQLDLNSTTALAVGGEGHLKLYKAGADAQSDFHFSSRLTIMDIAQ